MKYWLGSIVIMLIIVINGPWINRHIPAEYNPFAPIALNDPPTLITRYKMWKLDKNPQACMAVLERVQQDGGLIFSNPGKMSGKCPLDNPVRVRALGGVALSSSFLASCRLALSSAMFVSQVAKPLAQQKLGTPLIRIEHLGSYACRNMYNKPDARLSEHATAEALDVSGFQLMDGRHLTVLKQWPKEGAEADYMHTIFAESCGYFGNSIGPEYNAAHANHFHFGMRLFGFCR